MKEFLQQVLGHEGYYCIVGLKKDSDRPVQKFFQKLDDAVAVAGNLKDDGYDAYYALATFENGKSRRTNNVKQLRSLFIDLDCGAGKPYTTQQEALVALREFCKTVRLPKPTVVNSGGGIHAYWSLTEPVSRETWMPLAEKLKFLCDEHDLYADPVVTADSVRILRVPDTLNFKQDVARPVALIGNLAAPIELDTAKQIIGEVIAPKSYIPRGEMDDVTKALLGNYTNRFKTILKKTIEGMGCQQLAFIIKNQSTMSEPMWRAGLSIAKFCIDADRAIEKISSGHPEYSPEMADRKVRGIKGGPYTCAKFEEYNPQGCDGCPNKGSIKSPIVLGREIQEATDADNIVEDVPADVDQGHTQTYIIPKYPEPYFRGKNGGIYKRVIKQEEEFEVMVYHNDIYATRRLLDSDVGEAVVIRLHLPKDGVREFTIPLSAVTSKEEIRKHMASHGVAILKMDEIMSYVTQWVNHMQYNSRAETAHRQFGWTDKEHDAFILGDKEIRADRVDHNPPSSSTAQLFSAFKTAGTMEAWKEAMAFYNRPGMEMFQFAIGLSFGSPMTDFTSIKGAFMHIHSPDSGVGKTTAMYAGAGIWGDPEALIMKEVDTIASKMNRAEKYKNVPSWFDELTNASGKDLSDFFYQFTGGTQRNRLSQDANKERVRGTPWAQVGVSTGNTSVIERMGSYKAVPKAEALRVFEVRAYPMSGLNKIDTDILSEQLLNNYGHAALPYLQHIMTDMPRTKEIYKQTQQKLDRALGLGPADRFHSVTAANGIVGLMMAKEAGLLDWAIAPIVKWLLGAMGTAREQAASMTVNSETTLSNYLAENYNNVLRIKSTDDSRGSSSGVDHLVIPDATPRMTFVARYEYDVKMMYLYTKPLKEWCARQQINYQGLLDSLKNGRAKARIVKKRMSKGTNMTLPATDVIQLDTQEFLDDDLGKGDMS